MYAKVICIFLCFVPISHLSNEIHFSKVGNVICNGREVEIKENTPVLSEIAFCYAEYHPFKHGTEWPGRILSTF
jgi:hypothetical protein